MRNLPEKEKNPKFPLKDFPKIAANLFPFDQIYQIIIEVSFTLLLSYHGTIIQTGITG